MNTPSHLPKFVIAQRTVSYQVSEILTDMSDDDIRSLTLSDLLSIVDTHTTLDFGNTAYLTYTDEHGIDLLSRIDLDAPYPLTTP